MNKVIWTCWFQGRKNAPEVVKRCLASWQMLNPDWDFRCLDAETVGRFANLDGLIDLQKQQITAASLTDIVRLLLLKEYGGVWVDATLYCNRPLDEWLPLAMGRGFFAFSKPAPDRALASWFIAAEPGNMLLARWAGKVIGYWRDRVRSDDYFWAHRQFGELCATDRDARMAWESVPKISADGPHAIQQAGMYESLGRVGENIDWTTPVFKLTYRISANSWLPGSLLHHLLYDRDLVEFKPDEIENDKSRARAQIAGLKVSTENLGDHIQILAGLRLLKGLGLEPEQWIDRDNEIATADALDDVEQPHGMLLNGWFKTNPSEWPPHPKLNPVYLGFHIRLFQAPSLVSPEALDHYRRFGPIGCRDRYTLSLLTSNGVDAFLSHCLSLTLPRRLEDPANQTETFVVSRDTRILDHLPDQIRSGTFLSHYSRTTDYVTNMKKAAELLNIYRTRAKLIVTTMLHCALPAIAMGIPVVIFFPPNEGAQHRSDLERFSSLREMIRVFSVDESSAVDWRGYTVDVSPIKLEIADRLFRMAQRWGRISGVRLGPIAPSSILPVPTADQTQVPVWEATNGRAQGGACVPEREIWVTGQPASPNGSTAGTLPHF